MASSAGNIKAGQAYVELTLRDRVGAGLARVQQRMASLGRNLSIMGGALGGVSASLLGPLQLAVNSASDAFETLNKFNAVFGDLSDSASAFADTLSTDVNRGVNDIRNSLATFQSFLVGLGLDKTGAAELSKQLTEASIDFASFHNIADDEGMQRFISALSGSSEVLDRFGINIKQAALQQELLAQGVHKSWQEVSEQEKVMARLAIIMKTMGSQGALGDATRTVDTYASRLKGLQAAFFDLRVAIGAPMLKARADFMATITDILREITNFVNANQQLIPIVAASATGLALLGTAFITMGVASMLASSMLGLFSGAITAVLTPVVGLGRAVWYLTTSLLQMAATGIRTVIGAMGHMISMSLRLSASVASTAMRMTVSFAEMGVSILSALGPHGALAVGLIGLYAFHAFSGNLGATMKTLGDGMLELGAIAAKTGQGMFYAFANQDFVGLFGIIGQGMKAAWYETMQTMVDTTQSLLGERLLDIILGLGNFAWKFTVTTVEGVMMVLRPVFAIIDEIFDLLGTITEAFLWIGGHEIKSGEMSKSLGQKAEEARAQLDAMVEAQKAANKAATEAAGSDNPMAKWQIPGADGIEEQMKRIKEIQEQVTAKAKEGMADLEQVFDFKIKVDTGPIEKIMDIVKNFRLGSLFGGDPEGELEKAAANAGGKLQQVMANVKAFMDKFAADQAGGGGDKKGHDRSIFTTGGFNIATASLALSGGAVERTANAVEAALPVLKNIEKNVGKQMAWGA